MTPEPAPQDGERLPSQSPAEGEDQRELAAGTLDTGEPERPSDAGQGFGPDDHACTHCGSRRPHTIRRINIQGAPRLCDPCFDERKRP
jgi:hypothetical protein